MKSKNKIIKNRLEYNDKNFAVIEDWMIPILARGDNIKWKLSTIKLVLPNGISISEPKYSMSELTIDDNDSIYENSAYKGIISIEYIIERILNGITSCIHYRKN